MSTECPSCGRDDFSSDLGMRMHHSYAHGESLSILSLECEACGSTVERVKAEVERNDKVFCDIDCQHEWQSENWHESTHPVWKGGDVEMECSSCGEVTYGRPCDERKYENHFCSRECQFGWMSDNWSGESHPLWKGGSLSYDYYGSNWISFSEKIRRRDSHRCWFCGLSSSAHKVINGKDLEVHHLESVREKREKNQDPSNVLTLCVPCHRRFEYR